jgi:hypothetical protein
MGSSLTKTEIEDTKIIQKKEIDGPVPDYEQGFETVFKKLSTSEYKSKINSLEDLKKYSHNLSDVDALKNSYLNTDWAESLIIVKFHFFLIPKSTNKQMTLKKKKKSMKWYKE